MFSVPSSIGRTLENEAKFWYFNLTTTSCTVPVQVSACKKWVLEQSIEPFTISDTCLMDICPQSEIFPIGKYSFLLVFSLFVFLSFHFSRCLFFVSHFIPWFSLYIFHSFCSIYLSIYLSFYLSIYTHKIGTCYSSFTRVWFTGIEIANQHSSNWVSY